MRALNRCWRGKGEINGGRGEGGMTHSVINYKCRSLNNCGKGYLAKNPDISEGEHAA